MHNGKQSDTSLTIVQSQLACYENLQNSKQVVYLTDTNADPGFSQ